MERTTVVHCGKVHKIPKGQLSIDSVSRIHLTTSYLFESTQAILETSRGEADGYVYRRYGNENGD